MSWPTHGPTTTDAGRLGEDRPPATPSDGGAHAISVFEWIVAAIGLLLVIGTLGVLVRDATGGGPRPAVVVVRPDSVTAGAGRFLVHFTASNGGRETAASVGIAGELRASSTDSGQAGATETSRATLDYVPGRSVRRGVITFATDPRRGSLRLWAEGHQEP